MVTADHHFNIPPACMWIYAQTCTLANPEDTMRCAKQRWWIVAFWAVMASIYDHFFAISSLVDLVNSINFLQIWHTLSDYSCLNTLFFLTFHLTSAILFSASETIFSRFLVMATFWWSASGYAICPVGAAWKKPNKCSHNAHNVPIVQSQCTLHHLKSIRSIRVLHILTNLVIFRLPQNYSIPAPHPLPK